MQRSTALTAIATLGLTVVAGVSAIAVTYDQGSSVASGTPAAVTQYVDQYGNPVDPPRTDTASTATVTPSSSSVGRSVGTTVRVGENHEQEEDGD